MSKTGIVAMVGCDNCGGSTFVLRTTKKSNILYICTNCRKVGKLKMSKKEKKKWR